MLRVTPKKVALLVVLLLIVGGGVLTWGALETSYGQQKIAEYRAWCRNMWNSGIFHIMGGLIVFGGFAILGQAGGRPQPSSRPTPQKSGPLGGSAAIEGMLMGKHYDDPVKRKIARRRGVIDTAMRDGDL